ncbi:tRNA dimethylallyltransferase [Astathelohania contejeani]|uniref:tRNA dimethylallyltransferase n=1 Tax=Astathelohania contejeani TaxID=164912 RepID=A0ABQ7I2H0_9MICR|nr:tRNA dimethylallyltransferase [Thelohania contejeani]
MPAIIISGCTGIGKTKLALELTKEFPIRIISADSVQVYSGLDIGSNKERDNHMLIDLVPFNQKFTHEDYRLSAENAIRQSIEDGYTPLIVGGTGMYLEMLNVPIKFFLVCDRRILFRKTDLRCEIMVENGLLEEIAVLQKNGFDEYCIGSRGIGYRDGMIFINKLKSTKSYSQEMYNDFLHFLKCFQRRTRNYIRKQETFFRNKKYIWINCDKFDAKSIIKEVINGKLKGLEEIHNESCNVNNKCFNKMKTYQTELKIYNSEIKIKKVINNLIKLLK